MRLIDADELKERFCEENCGNNRCIDHMDKCTWICSVEESKTVFDLDKVFKKLEEVRNRHYKLMFSYNDLDERKKCMEIEYAIRLAIEIVKGGKVE